jgi:hypothetical protein
MAHFLQNEMEVTDINMETLLRKIAKQALIAGLLATPATFVWAKSTVSVSVHGVNYSNETFSYSVGDPNNNKDPTAGELVDRFAAGGTVCCYDLPTEWKPGIKIKVNSVHWLKETADKKLPEVEQVFVVEVPPYVDGKAGELWVLRQPDGTVEVVSSDYQPNHHKWPGKVKGWPVPSLEYQRERWDLQTESQAIFLRAAEKRRVSMERDMSAYATEAWQRYKRNSPEDIKNFVGPDDMKFQTYLMTENDQQRSRLRKEIEQLKARRP